METWQGQGSSLAPGTRTQIELPVLALLGLADTRNAQHSLKVGFWAPPESDQHTKGTARYRCFEDTTALTSASRRFPSLLEIS